MEGVKSFLLSKTVWGTILTVAALVAPKLGLDLGEQGAWADEIVGFFGAALALYGRITAVKKIG